MTGVQTCALPISAQPYAVLITVPQNPDVDGTPSKPKLNRAGVPEVGHTVVFSITGCLGMTGLSSWGNALTINNLNGFSSSVGLSLSGTLPTGATWGFSPNSTTSTSTLTIQTLSSSPAGTYPLTINGSGGGINRTASISLTVTKPDYSLSISGTQNVARGNGATYQVTVNPLNSWTGTVNLSVTSALPTGVTVQTTAGTNSTKGTVAFSTTTSTPIGSFNFTVQGTDAATGLLIHTVQGTLTITSQGGFNVTLTPNPLSIRRGTTGSYSVGVACVNGFSSTVSLTVSGVPSRVTSTLSNNGIATCGGIVTLSLSVPKTASLTSNATITVTGTGGGLSVSGSANLSITN